MTILQKKEIRKKYKRVQKESERERERKREGGNCEEVKKGGNGKNEKLQKRVYTKFTI